MSKQTVSAAGGAMPAEGLTTRRATLCALAAAPLAAVLSAAPAAATGVDPIFAAIERHKADYELFGDLCIRNDEVAAEQEGRTITQADRDAYEAASSAEIESLAALKATAPTTLGGMRAAIEHFVRYDGGSVPEESGEFLATLLKSPLLAA